MNVIWSVAAQGASSLGNVLLTIFIARGSSVETFAGFALVFPLFVLVQRTNRVLLLIPRQIDAHSRPTTKSRTIDIATSSTALGATFAVVLSFGIPLVPDLYQPWLLMLAVALPGLACYDAFRSELLTRENPRQATVLDLSWLLLQIGFSVAFTAAALPIYAIFLAWLLPPTLLGTCFLVVSWARAGGRPSLSPLIDSRKYVWDALSDLWNSVLVVQLLPYALVAATDALASAAFRAGQTLLGPVNTLVMGLQPVIQIRIAKENNDVKAARRSVLLLASFLCIPLAPFAILLNWIPAQVGTQLLGPTWHDVQPLLFGLSALMVARVPVFVVTTALRSLRMTRTVVWFRYLSSTLLLLSAIACALTWGIGAVAWGMTLSAAASSLIGITLLFQATKDTRKARHE